MTSSVVRRHLLESWAWSIRTGRSKITRKTDLPPASATPQLPVGAEINAAPTHSAARSDCRRARSEGDDILGVFAFDQSPHHRTTDINDQVNAFTRRATPRAALVRRIGTPWCGSLSAHSPTGRQGVQTLP
jgi:hypothetical protein